MQEFKHKVAVVTGAASGIGLAMARQFAELGCNVVLADIEAAALEQAGQQVAALGAEYLTVQCNVADAAAVEQLANTCVEHFGAIHIACNNAGVFVGGHCWEATLADYEWLIGVNQYGVIHGIRSFLPRMLAHGEECHMVNTASMAALTSMPYSGIYNMSKHAVLALSESLYHELSLGAPQVGLSCLCPESFATGIGHSQRNRPAKLGDAPASDTRQLAADSIINTTAGGKDPQQLAARVVQAIRDRQFYILSDDSWRDIANARLDDIRLGQNPTLVVPDM